jgi:hypothetical protein
MSRSKVDPATDPLHGGAVHVHRSRGAVSGILLIVPGVCGAFIAFVGPWFDFGRADA